MKPPAPHGGDRAWRSAWAAFTTDDAAAAPPMDLEQRVRDAVQLAQLNARSNARGARRRWPLGALMAAAALLLVSAGVVGALSGWRLVAPGHDARNPGHLKVAPTKLATPWQHEPSPIQRHVPRQVDRVEAPAPAVADMDAAPDASVPLALALVPPPETVQLVRIRMPVTALAALGIAAADPDASGVVDVDVTVGDDGLARDIRGIHAVPASARE